MDRHMSSSSISGLLFVAILGGCSSSAIEDLRRQSDLISSLSNSAQMALVAWRLDEVPDRYAQLTLEALQDDIEDASKDIDGTLLELHPDIAPAINDIVAALSAGRAQIRRQDRNAEQVSVDIGRATGHLRDVVTAAARASS
jgi:hypothetical protein